MEKNSALDMASNYGDVANYTVSKELSIPAYLQETYWWAYIHPTAVYIFERQWLVNLILWGNFSRLRDSALDEIGTTIEGDNLQVACVYGDLSHEYAARLSPESELHIVDIAPVQLENVSKKIDRHANVYVHHQDSARLNFNKNRFDNVVVFFLLHEQPESVRIQTIKEAMRVTKPGGKVVFVDYHQPRWTNPLRYVMVPILRLLEPFALDMWRKEIVGWLPPGCKPKHVEKETMFGGLYQKVTIWPHHEDRDSDTP